MNDLVSIRRALLSVSDKSDLVPFARFLAQCGVEMISTGGTAKVLADAGLPVVPIERLTGFPEILGGRVKTLHPMVHGGLLAVRGDRGHEEELRRHGIRPIDLVCVNLYPFRQAAADPGLSLEAIMEQMDIGGPAMIRSAAKNFASVTVITDPGQYDRVVGELRVHEGCTTRRLRAELAAAALGHTAAYDAAIAAYLARTAALSFPSLLHLDYEKVCELRYGENPHQHAALYRDPAYTGASVVGARRLHGPDLSYNNVADAAAALSLVQALGRLERSIGSIATGVSLPGQTAPTTVARSGSLAVACVIKHTNPCGVGVARDAGVAAELALAGDSQAAYGGIMALSTPVEVPVAERLCGDGVFLEVVVAPRFAPEAAAMLRQRWARVRLLEVGGAQAQRVPLLEYRSVPGGMLVQEADGEGPGAGTENLWRHAAGPAPSHAQLRLAAYAEVVVRALSSNAIAIVNTPLAGPAEAVMLVGGGSGLVDRLTACRVAVDKAGDRARGGVAASDAFFPFPDGPRVLIEAGVSMIVHPGGSRRDVETFELCQQYGVCCMVTGVRRFRH